MRKLLLTLILFSVFLTSFASAETLFCLEEGSVIEFSLCNPSITDYTCGTTSCQVCVNEISPGVFCPANSCQNSCVAFNGEINDNDLPADAPTIELLTPEDNHQQDLPTTINFEYTVSQPGRIDECTLLLNGIEILTDSVAGYGSFSSRLEEGTYSWGIKCLTKSNIPGQDRLENRVIPSDFRKIIIGEEQEDPEPIDETNETSDIILNDPTNNLVLTGTKEVSFTFDFSDSVTVGSLSQCSLFLNSAEIVKSITELGNIFKFSQTLGADTYIWHIECNSFSSETRTLIIESPAADDGDTSPSSNGPSSNRRRTTTTNTPTTQDNEVEQLEETEGEETQTETELGIDTAGITGSVIGRALKTKTGATIALVILVGVLGFLVYNKKRKS